ncbi:MAG: TerB family tellurite resistance protein [Myxococcales bacterium]|nr:TerB family tellurite resistance protein [Myxococcales bacterium]
MSGALQVLTDCPHCHVESALVELVDSVARLHLARCRLCGLELSEGEELRAGARFASQDDVRSALRAWADDEGEDLAVFVSANFAAGTVDAVCSEVLGGQVVRTSFDVIAWLFKNRMAGAVALGAPMRESTPGLRPSGDGGEPPVTPPLRPDVRGAAAPSSSAPVRDPRATTLALVATALADGRVAPEERALVERLCASLGAPLPRADDWRAWRPNEVGVPPDPVATVEGMRRVALADRIADLGEERVIREFARTWRVPLPDPVLPPVTAPQKLAAAWLGLFSR